MLVISKHQLASLGDAVTKRFEDRVMKMLNDYLPDLVAPIDPSALQNAVRQGIKLAPSYEMTSEKDVARLILLSLVLGMYPELRALQRWAVATLNDASMQPRARLQTIFDRVALTWRPTVPPGEVH